MYAWTTQFEMHPQTTQTSPSMHPPTAVTQNFMPASYVAEERRSPGPPPLYMGGYAVSDGTDQATMPPHNGPIYLNVSHSQHPDNMMLRSDSSMGLDVHRELQRRQLATAPLLAPQDAEPVHEERRESLEEAYIAVQAHMARASQASPKRRLVQSGPRMRKARVAGRKSTQGKAAQQQQSDPQEEHKNCRGEEVPPVLKANCPEEERCIFESRWRHRHQKGQDMWDSIQTDFEKKFNKHGKEMLQMKFKRGRSKYIEWLPEDEAILREAWSKMEKERYQMLLDKFHELGGSRNMRLNSSDIEVKLVNDLKLEEGLYVESFGDLGIRRRRKLATKKRLRGNDDNEGAVNDGMGNGTLPHHIHTTSNEDEVINQVHGREPLEWDADSTMGGDMMDMHMWGARPIKTEPNMAPHVNHYLARQAQDARFHKARA
jgi:hypothetical protein